MHRRVLQCRERSSRKAAYADARVVETDGGRWTVEYLFEFNTNDKTDLDRLGDIGGGLDTLELRRTIQHLRRYEFARIAPREPPPIILHSKVAA